MIAVASESMGDLLQPLSHIGPDKREHIVGGP